MNDAIYTPEDVFCFVMNGDTDKVIVALNQSDNSNNWYRNIVGSTAIHIA